MVELNQPVGHVPEEHELVALARALQRVAQAQHVLDRDHEVVLAPKAQDGRRDTRQDGLIGLGAKIAHLPDRLLGAAVDHDTGRQIAADAVQDQRVVAALAHAHGGHAAGVDGGRPTAGRARKAWTRSPKVMNDVSALIYNAGLRGTL
jgi:hypothetical protein